MLSTRCKFNLCLLSFLSSAGGCVNTSLLNGSRIREIIASDPGKSKRSIKRASRTESLVDFPLILFTMILFDTPTKAD